MKNIVRILLLLMIPLVAFSQPGAVISYKKISAASGGFQGLAPGMKYFGASTGPIGDLNNDGIGDIAVQAYDADANKGIVFILFLDTGFTVKSYTAIGPNIGGLNGSFPYSMSTFGSNINAFHDLDGDGIKELLVTNVLGGGNSTGQLFVVYLNANGTVKSYKIIGSSDLVLFTNNYFGSSLSVLDDLDRDGIPEVAVGATGDGAGGFDKGAVFILFLNANGTLRKYSKISAVSGGFTGVLNNVAQFGNSLSSLGDLNKDGVGDLIVSTGNQEEMWVLFLDSSGMVKSHQKIDRDSGQYTDTISVFENFATKVSLLGDIDGDDVPDIAVSSPTDSVNGIDAGRVRILLMNTNGTVKSIKRIDNNSPGFLNVTVSGELFGAGLSRGEDYTGDFKNDLIIGSSGQDDGGTDKGAIYLLSLDGAIQPVKPKSLWKVNTTSGNSATSFHFSQYASGFPDSYQWQFTPDAVNYLNGTGASSANPSVTFKADGQYSVSLKVHNPFGSDSIIRNSYIHVLTTGIADTDGNHPGATIYPNPTTKTLFIRSSQKIRSLTVYDHFGRKMFVPFDQDRELINTGVLAPGIYTLQLDYITGQVNHKAFIVHGDH